MVKKLLTDKVKFCLIPVRLLGLYIYMCIFGLEFVCDLVLGVFHGFGGFFCCWFGFLFFHVFEAFGVFFKIISIKFKKCVLNISLSIFNGFGDKR